EIAEWLRKRTGAQKVRLESRGIRTEAIALVVAALQPDVFSDVVVHEGMASLDYALQVPVTFQNAPELFCLDLYKEFDMDRLAAMAAPSKDSAIASLERDIPGLMEQATLPGLSAAVVRNGQTYWLHGFGVMNATSSEAVTPDTVFEAASLSKPVFAYGVLKLVDQGKLS